MDNHTKNTNSGRMNRSRGRIADPLAAYQELLKYYREAGRMCFGTLSRGSALKDPDPKHLYEMTMFPIIVRTGALAITKKGYMALVPVCSKSGDHVGIFMGAEVPYVLRSDGERGEYSLVGACYVQGVMDGDLDAFVNGWLRAGCPLKRIQGIKDDEE